MDLGESIFIKCDCGGCNVLEFNFDKEYGQFNLAVWSYHPGEPKFSKKEKTRWCDHVMKTGRPWADHTIITKKEVQRLIKFLTKQLKNTQYGKNTKNRKSNSVGTSK